jgi:hypothetical protein
MQTALSGPHSFLTSFINKVNIVFRLPFQHQNDSQPTRLQLVLDSFQRRADYDHVHQVQLKDKLLLQR